MLETPIVDLIPPQVVVLTGEDLVLKRLITNHFSKAINCDDIDQKETKSTEQLANFIEEGSLFGSRFLQIEFQGKWGRLDAISRALNYVQSTDDYFIIRSEEVPSSEKVRLSWSVIECKNPGNKKSREKLIKTLSPLYSLNISEESLKKFAERTENTAQIEQALNILSLITPKNYNITLTDVNKVTKEQSTKKDISRSIIRKNLVRLVRDISEADSPHYVLTILHSTLLKVYTWLEMIEFKVEEKMIADLLGLPPRAIRDWRMLSKFYSSRAVRECLEAAADAYDAVNKGQSWREKLIRILERLT